MILEVNGINTFYGLSHILFDVSLSVDQKEVVCMIGRNGAGKTTLFRSIMGLTPCQSGSIKFKGQEIAGRRTFKISRLGVGLVPEERQIFPDLTVWENLDIGRKQGLRENGWTIDQIYDLFPALKPLHKRRGGLLSGGEQQMLSIARTLMGNPQVLLLDEPTEGLAPIVVHTLEEQILKLKDAGVAILASEQNLKSANKIGNRAYILDKGMCQFEGTIKELQGREDVMRKFLAV
jgi:branched-chain amino acid transport system ATP-binding protein